MSPKKSIEISFVTPGSRGFSVFAPMLFKKVFTYFASFTGYADDIFEVISYLHVQGSKFGGKFEKFGGKSFTKIELCGVFKVFYIEYTAVSIFFTSTTIPTTFLSDFAKTTPVPCSPGYNWFIGFFFKATPFWSSSMCFRI